MPLKVSPRLALAFVAVFLLPAAAVILAPSTVRPTAVASADPGDGPVALNFLRGGQLVPVERVLAGVDEARGVLPPALEALLKGPTSAERRVGFGTAIPSGVSVSRVRVDEGEKLATLTLSRRFGEALARPADAADSRRVYDARLAQVVYTVSAVTGFKKVTVHVAGRPKRTLTPADFEKPSKFVTPRPAATNMPAPADPRAVQTSLVARSYLPSDAVTGKYDYRTQQAVTAFQGWEGLPRSGVADARTVARLAAAKRPVPLSRAAGQHVEIYRKRGVVLLIDGKRVIRAIHTSTGTGGDSPNLGTPPGEYAIYRKESRSWSVPYKTWLPFAAFWSGGWGLHGDGEVPGRPASQGTARLPMLEAKYVYDFVSVGTPVRVL